jgi:hypothetical protein
LNKDQMANPIPFKWHSDKGQWGGMCPRCGMGGFFPPVHSNNFSNKTIEILHCPGSHTFIVEFPLNTRSAPSVFPQEWFQDVPGWLPELFHEVFDELTFAWGNKKYRSVVAMAGLLLEAHVNEVIPTEGDKKKSLFDRLEVLKAQGRIDHDQFSNATVTRLTRKNVLHPKDIVAPVTEKEAEEAMNSVILYLEGAYKYKPSRALPSGDSVASASTSSETEKSPNKPS